MTVFKKQDDLYAETTKMADLVETYNALTGKTIKKFESMDVGRVRCANAILASEDRSGHAGVPKNAKPEVKTVDELPLKEDAANPAEVEETKTETEANPPEEEEMTAAQKERARRFPTAHAQEVARKKAATARKAAKAKGSAAPAKKVAAKKAKVAPAKKVAAKKATGKVGRHNVYEKVKFTEPDVLRRPQEGSNRSLVLAALKKRKNCTIDQLSEDVGFNARSYVHKLVFQGWAEVQPAKE